MSKGTTPRRRRLVASVLSAVMAAALGVGGWLAVAPVRRDLATPVELARVPYVRSSACQRCHPDHTASWRRTFHRTMTQEAAERSVLGDFSGVALSYDGVTSRMYRSGERFVIETVGADGKRTAFDVVRTVGSRRFQQYLTRAGDRYLRLPWAWSIEEQRWLHLNGAFLDPDGTPFSTHQALWDANCIFCHNVKARPGYDWQKGTFASAVEELGIGCEACHGPGGEHVSRNANPLRRYALHYSEAADPAVVQPERLTPLRSIQVCGHCHGQRLPKPLERIRQLMATGDPFTPGEDLSRYTEPLQRDSQLPGVDVTLRFWGDGSPRLTAHEYQGLVGSACFLRGGLTCLGCHSAHEGDPRGMIRPELRTAQACARCHPAVVQNATAHSRHRSDGAGADCYACHLPKTVFGLLSLHPSHRIDNPEPSRVWRHQMPDACTLCHTDRSAVWAATERAKWPGAPSLENLRLQSPRNASATGGLPTDVSFQLAESVRALLAGDVVQRAVAAESLGAAASYTAEPAARLWAAPFLMLAMEDRYPAVRRIAHRSLKALVARASAKEPRFAPEAGLSGDGAFDALAPPDARAERLAHWRAWWRALDKGTLPRPDRAVPLDDAFEPRADLVQDLLARQDTRPVSIGE